MKQQRSNHPASNGGKWVRPDKRLAIYLRDQFTCIYCKRDLSSLAARFRTLDHVVPVADGGKNDADNLVTCCKWCNDSKGAKSAMLFIATRYDATTPEGLAETIDAMGRVNSAMISPCNRVLAKQILAGTLDLSDVLGGER